MTSRTLPLIKDETWPLLQAAMDNYHARMSAIMVGATNCPMYKAVTGEPVMGEWISHHEENPRHRELTLYSQHQT